MITNSRTILTSASLLTILILILPFDSYSQDSISNKSVSDRSTVHLLPDYYIYGTVGTFLFHKNETFKKNYLMETDLNFGLDFISFLENFHSVWDINIKVGVGKQFEDVVFDPRWLTIAIVPSLEYRFNSLITQIALDRRCFHEVDHEPARMTVYWTLPYILVGSPNMRQPVYEENIFSKDQLTITDRLSWFGKTGWFIDHFFNYPSDLTGGGHEYKFMLNFGARYTFIKINRWASWISHQTNLYTDKNSDCYFTEDIELNNTFHGENFNITLFLNYTLFDDKHEYKNMNKDQLGELGLRFTF